MALKPVLKAKVDEFFLQWLSDPDVQRSLQESLQQIANGEAVSAAGQRQPSSLLARGSSPRVGNSSLVTSTSPKLPSPRSPRRPLQAKKQNSGSTETTRPVLTVNNKDKEISNHVGPATTTTSPNAVSSGGDIRAQQHQPQQLRGAKDVSSDGNGDGLLSHEPGSGKRRLQTSERDLLAPGQKPNQRPLPGPREPTAEKGNKENRPKKRGGLPRSASDVHIPAFYFPRGRPGQGPDLDTTLHRLSQEFSALDGGKAYKQQMPAVTKACGLPLYWKILLFRAAGGSSEGYVTFHGLSALLKKLHQNYHDDASKFMRLTAKPGATVLEFEDFEPLMQDVVETHPGLTFLQDAPEFHSRYVTTVISRVMYCVNRSWSGCISLPELRCANFLQTLHKLESEEDINQVKEFFSYEHFYVIYCKFWELDKDHDLYIDKNDLSRHNDHALNSRLIDRIFSGAVTRGEDFQGGRMSYREFVWFLLAEEDKKHPTSIEYWFRCMDLDGDGVISMYEMEYFHEEQMNKMEALGIERLPFEDTVCQMMDMVCPRREGKITLGDLKACQMTSIFFDTFFNLDKFLEHEQRDPFANARDPNAEIVAVSDWERYAEEEYDILVADEGNADLEDGHYEDDFEPEDDDEILREEMLRLADKGPPQRNMTGQSHTAEDIYDFSGTTNLGY